MICCHFQLHHHLPCSSIPQHHDNAAHRGHLGRHLDNMWGVSRAHGEVLRLQVHHDLLCRLLRRLLGDYLLPLHLHVHAGTHPCQEDRCSAHRRRGEVSASAVEGQQHERSPDSHHPVRGFRGVLGAIFPPPHHHHGVPHEPVLRVLPIAVPAACGAVDEPRPHWPSHLCLPQCRAQTYLQEDAALFRLEAVLIEKIYYTFYFSLYLSTESTLLLFTCRLLYIHGVAYIYTRESTIHRPVLPLSSCGQPAANNSLSSVTFSHLVFEVSYIKATTTYSFIVFEWAHMWWFVCVCMHLCKTECFCICFFH